MKTAICAAIDQSIPATVLAFINQRSVYITELLEYRGTYRGSEYWLSAGHTQARAQLAKALGLTVPYEPGETATSKPSDRDEEPSHDSDDLDG